MAGLDEGKGELARKKEAGYGKTEQKLGRAIGNDKRRTGSGMT
jgi:hypothetical protein